jgi:small-conductance mechanosensitive channel
MLNTQQSTLPLDRNTLFILLGALLIFLLFFYLVAIDNGFLLSLVQGQVAYSQNFIHELTHDARHTAGFPCH